MANLWLIDTDTLIKAKSSICTDKKDDYIDALCERLAEVNRNYQQITEVITDETMIQNADVGDLKYYIQELKDEIKDLKIDIENLKDEILILKQGE